MTRRPSVGLAGFVAVGSVRPRSSDRPPRASSDADQGLSVARNTVHIEDI